MFGDNKSVVDSPSNPNAKLHKCHTMLSFHHVCEAIAYGVCKFFHIDGKYNPVDTLSKHWSYTKIKDMLKPLLFWSGDNMKLWKEDQEERVVFRIIIYAFI